VVISSILNRFELPAFEGAFAGTDMGEDALRVLNEYIALYGRIRSDAAAELPHCRAAANWAARLP
jgi:hypothetical protein